MNNADIIGLQESSLVAEIAKSAGVGFGDATKVLRKLTQLPTRQWIDMLVWLIDERIRVANSRRTR